MKKFTTLALAGLVATSVFGQQPAKQKFVASPEQINATAQNVKNQMIFHDVENTSIVRAVTLPIGPVVSPNGKVAAVNPIIMGSSSNAFTILRQEQNQVFANDDLDAVGFTHRNNAAVYGGSSGNLRYDLSIDGGTTFTNDIGPVNPTLSLPSRYPQGMLYNPAGNTNPLAAYHVNFSPTLGNPTWDGVFNGVSLLTQGAPVNPTEHYDFQGTGTLLAGGLCEGLPGEFWSVDGKYNGSNQTGPITIFKGVFAAGDVTWTNTLSLAPNNDLTFDGNPKMIGPNISFSPDGSVGWIAFLGDIVGGVDSVYSPCFSKTTDNGATWSTTVEYDLNTLAWVKDSLQSLWTDSLGNPAADGIASGAFDYDFTVDGDGNPHMAVVICNHATTGYSVGSGTAKFMADVYSPDGGATWNVAYISPVLTFRTQAFGGTATTVTMDNNTQIARSQDGQYIFFAWSDSDTALVTGNQNGIGFGVSDNEAPNLRISALNTADWTQSYPKLVTDGDLIWEGRALFPTMAPTVLSDGAGCFKLPIVLADMPANEPVDPTFFHYFGNDATICSSTLCDPGQMTLAWDAFAFSGASPVCAVGVKNNVESNVVLGNAYPNPTANNAVITFELPTAGTITIDMVNMFGQQVAVLANGEYNSGAHKVVVNTEKLAAGVYFYSLRTNDQVLSKRLVVSK